MNSSSSRYLLNKPELTVDQTPMKSASLNEVKKELALLSAKQLAELCLSVAKYKKDNKEFLAYLLFQSADKTVFLIEIKSEVDLLFNDLDPHTNLYYVKKSLRKVLRMISKYSKYLGDKALSADLYIYFCVKLKESRIPYRKSQLLVNMYEQQIKKILKLISSLHEDLRSDYDAELQKIID